MTVAVGIKIGMSGRSESGQSQALARGAAKAQGPGWTGAVATNAASTSASGAESFRSGLQSLLASLSADGNGLIQEDPVAVGIQAQADSALTGSPGKTNQPASQPASLPGEDSALSLIPARIPAANSAAIATQLPLLSKQATIPAWLATSNPPPQVAADLLAKSTAIAPSGGSPRSNQATSSAQAPKQKAAPTTGGSQMAYATAGNVPQAILAAPSTLGPIENAAVPAPILPFANLAAAAPTKSQLDSSNQYSQLAAGRDASKGGLSPAGNQTSGTVSGAAMAHELQPAGFNDRVESTAYAEAHAPNMATGSLNERSLAPGNLHVSAGNATESSSPAEEIGTQTAELSPANPAGFKLNKAVEGTFDAASPAKETGTQTAELSPANPAGFGVNEAVKGETYTGIHVPNIVTGSPDPRPSTQNDLPASAGKATDAASPEMVMATRPAELSPAHPAVFDALSGAATSDGNSAPVVATGAREVNPVIPVGTIGSTQVTGKAGDPSADAGGSATARSFYPGSRSSAAVPGHAPSSQVAIGGGIPSPLVGASLNPSTSPSVPVRASRASEPLVPATLAPSSGPQSRIASGPVGTATLIPSSGTQSRIASEPVGQQNITPSSQPQSVTADNVAQSSSPTRSQTEGSLEPSSQAHTPTQPRPASQGVETAAAPTAADWLGQASTLQAVAPLQPAPVTPISPVDGKTGLATGGGNQSGIRSVRGVRAASTVAQGNNQADGQIAGRSTDSSAQVRDLSSANAPTSLAGSAGSAGSATSPSAHETFAALDGETVNASPAWTHAGTPYAEAGFHDPALGWVGVRADSASGGVHASLVPDSPDAAQALGGHVAGLNTYLAEQHTPVETLTVAAPENRSLASGQNQSSPDQSGMNQSGSQGMHQGAGQDSGQASYSQAPSFTQQNTPAVTEAVEAAPAGRLEPSASAVGSGGRHISVMA